MISGILHYTWLYKEPKVMATVLDILPLREQDDFGQPLTREEGEILYDAKTVHGGAWAIMTEVSWRHHRMSKYLGAGTGQKYQLTADGQYTKVQG